MRKLKLQAGAVLDSETNAPVSCWCKNVACDTTCAACAQVTMMKPDRSQDLVLICAAVPQQIPIGVLNEGAVAVVPPGPSLIRG